MAIPLTGLGVRSGHNKQRKVGFEVAPAKKRYVMARDRLATLAQTAQRHVDAGTFDSIEWQVQHRGVLLDAGRVGSADSDSHAPIPDQAIYRIYSMTKSVIATYSEGVEKPAN